MDFNKKILSTSPDQTQKIGWEIGEFISKNQNKKSFIICLHGNLGSGKTTFVQGLAKSMGVKDRLTSPTFLIVKQYLIPEPATSFYHIDLYRLKTESELTDLGFDEIINNNSIVCIEWAEKIPQLSNIYDLDISFNIESDQNHTMMFRKNRK